MEYFYLDQSQQQVGPLSLEQLTGLMQSGSIFPNTLVSYAGAEGWVELSSLLSPPHCVSPVSPIVNIPNYLVLSIIVTILCCVPLGIVAILSACKVDKYIACGDVMAAQAASKNAKKWIIISAISGVVVGLIYTVATTFVTVVER